MKLEDVKVGQILKDKFGNKYEVVQIDDADKDFMPVELKCVEFVKEVCFGRNIDIITKIEHHSWVLKNRLRILSSDSIVGEFLKNHYSHEYNSFVDGLNLVDLTFNDTNCRFLFGDAKAVKKVDVTLDDLYVDDVNYPTKDNSRIDDIIVDKSGVEYRIVAKYSSGIEAVYKREFIGVDGVVFNVNSKIYVPFPNDTQPNGTFTTKEFVKKINTF